MRRVITLWCQIYYNPWIQTYHKPTCTRIRIGLDHIYIYTYILSYLQHCTTNINSIFLSSFMILKLYLSNHHKSKCVLTFLHRKVFIYLSLSISTSCANFQSLSNHPCCQQRYVHTNRIKFCFLSLVVHIFSHKSMPYSFIVIIKVLFTLLTMISSMNEQSILRLTIVS